MFKRKEDKKGLIGIPASPYSSVLGFIAAFLSCLFVSYLFLNLTEVVKWVGVPLMILPDAVGLVDRPSKDEVARVVGPQNSEFEVELIRTGPYNLFRSFWDDWGVEVGEYPGISIEGPNGLITLEYDRRNPTLYDTPSGHGIVHARFEIEEPGTYIVRYERTNDTLRKKFDASLIPDYISGSETKLLWAFIIQIAIIVVPTGVFIYGRYIKPYLKETRNVFKTQNVKRDSMNDFLDDLKKGQRQ